MIHAREKKKAQISISILHTNGLLLDEKTMGILMILWIILTLSLDGRKLIHDSMRLDAMEVAVMTQ